MSIIVALAVFIDGFNFFAEFVKLRKNKLTFKRSGHQADARINCSEMIRNFAFLQYSKIIEHFYDIDNKVLFHEI